MNRNRALPSKADASHQQLADEVLRLTDEVRVLRDAIDELREVFSYAVHNGRVEIGFVAEDSVDDSSLSLTTQSGKPRHQRRLF